MWHGHGHHSCNHASKRVLLAKAEEDGIMNLKKWHRVRCVYRSVCPASSSLGTTELGLEGVHHCLNFRNLWEVDIYRLNPTNQSYKFKTLAASFLYPWGWPWWPPGMGFSRNLNPQLGWGEALWWPSEHWVRTQIRLDKQKTQQRDVLEPVGSMGSVPASSDR